MTPIPYHSALIVGAGAGISASVARKLAAEGVRVALAARNTAKLAGLAGEIGAEVFPVDVADLDSVTRLFAAADAAFGAPEVVVFNAAARLRGPIAELDPRAVEAVVAAGSAGAFAVTREAARRMIPAGKGAILFTGATASLKAYAHSAPFAMAKFALRALAQSAARELGPMGIHVAHFVIDGVVRSAARPDPAESPDSTLDPDAIADAYLAVLRQPRSAWSFEVELRPWVERF